jgi:hypothetical protein
MRFSRFPSTTDFSARRQATEPAAVTLRRVERQGRRQRSKEPPVFLDLQVICHSRLTFRQNHSEIALSPDTFWLGNQARSRWEHPCALAIQPPDGGLAVGLPDRRAVKVGMAR